MSELILLNKKMKAFSRLISMTKRSNGQLESRVNDVKEKTARLKINAEQLLSDLKRINQTINIKEGHRLDPHIIEQNTNFYQDKLIQFNNTKVLYIDSEERLVELMKRWKKGLLYERKLKEAHKDLVKNMNVLQEKLHMEKDIIEVGIQALIKAS